MLNNRNTLTSLFARSVARHPERPAVEDDDQSISYRELDAMSDRLAVALTRAGVGPTDHVVVDAPRSIAVAVSVLGVLKAGAAYLPVDPRTPVARREAMVRIARPTLTVVSGNGPAGNDDVGTLRYHDALRCAGALVPSRSIEPADPAAILFTSGSAGRPKGVVLEHGNLVFFATNPGLPKLYPDDRVGQISSIGFDAFSWELWATLAAGACLVVLPDVPDLLADDIQRELRRYDISAMLVPTMVANQVTREDRDAFAALRLLQVGGDVLLPATCRDILAGAFRGELYNLYGPAEGTTACTSHQVTEADVDRAIIPIGRPLPGVTAVVRDSSGREVTAGTVGDLVIGGPGVARGYLAPADGNSFGSDPSVETRWYRTGDLVRQANEGVFEFLGRADNQVKIRGFRVEPDEVERVLRGHPGVHDAVVLADGVGEDQRLVAFVVLDDLVTPAELREYSQARLNHFMVPSRFVRVNEMGATEHGKRDVAALALLAERERTRDGRYDAPGTDIERYLANLFEELLGIERIGIREDFFGLGGHSLMAIRVQSRIRTDLGVSIGQDAVFRYPMLRDLALAIEKAVGR